MPKVNEIKNIFTLDTGDFDKYMKSADKSVDALKKSINAAKAEAIELRKEADKVSNAFKDLNNIKVDIDVSKDIKNATKELDEYKKKLNEIKKDAEDLKKSFKNFDLSSIDKAYRLLDKVKETKLVDLSNLQSASSKVNSIVSDLKSIDTDITVTQKVQALDNANSGLNNGLRHWIDNNGADLNQASDDTHKVLQDILTAAREINTKVTGGSNTGSQTSPEVNIDMSPLNRMNQIFGDALDRIDNINDTLNVMSSNTDNVNQDTIEYSNELSRVQQELDEINKTQESIASDTMIYNSLREIEELIRHAREDLEITADDFETIDEAADRLSNDVKQIYEPLVNSSNAAQQMASNFQNMSADELRNELDKCDTTLSRLRAGSDSINQELTKWESNLRESRQEMTQLDTQIEELLNKHEILRQHSGHQEELQAIDAQLAPLRQRYNLLRREEILQSHITNELRQQRNRVVANTQSQRQYRTALNQQLNQQQLITQQQQRQNQQLQQQQQNAKSLKGIFKGIYDAVKPIADFFGVGNNSVVQNISGLGSAASQSAGQVSQLSSSLGSASGASGGLASSSIAASAAIGGVTVAIGAAIAAITGYVSVIKATFKVVKETISEFGTFEKAMAKVSAICRQTAEEYRGFKDEFKDGFMSQGYTEDVNEYADALQRVKLQLEGLQQNDLGTQDLTKNIMNISYLTGYDPNEVIRAARNMSINFNQEISKSLDMILSAYEKTGDPMNDLLDTFQEYSSQFKKTGVSAEWFYNIITKGSEAGVFNTDKIADSFKELYLRISEGSDDVVTNMNKLGLSTSKTMEEIQKGGPNAEAAINNIVKKISEVQDQAERQNIIAALFGSPGEDLGNAFFDTMAEAEIAIGEWQGSVEDAANTVENTLAYQISELKNSFSTLKSEVGESFAPVVKEVVSELNDNMGEIVATVRDELIPAFGLLLFAIVDPFTQGASESDNFAVTVIKGIANAIEGVAMFVNAINKIVAAFRLVTNAVEIVWNVIQALFYGLGGLIDAIVYGIAMAIGKIIDGVVNMATNLGTIANNIGIAFNNAWEGIKASFLNAFTWIEQKAAEKVNGIIDMLNTIPNTNISHVTWGSDGGYKPNYKAFKQLTDNSNIYEMFKGRFDYAMDVASKGLNKQFSDIAKDWGDMQSAWAELTAAPLKDRYSNFTDKINDLLAKQEKQSHNTSKTNKQLEKQKQLTNDITKGTDKVGDKEKKKGDSAKKTGSSLKKQNDALKEQEKLMKKVEEAQKAIYEEQKRLIKVKEQYENDMRSWQEEIIAQQVKLIENDEQKYLYEIEAIQKLRDEYVLTANEQIKYQQKQFDLALNLREYYVDKAKKEIKKEIEAVKDGLDKELEYQKQNSEDRIKAKQKEIDAIEALMRENEYNDEQEDLDKEIKKTLEELDKYANATSFEGIQKRNDLEEELENLRTQKARKERDKELEDKKASLEQEIDDIKEADEKANEEAERRAKELEKIYDKMFEDLEDAVDSGMNNISEIQALYQKETNSTIKGLLGDLIKEYENATNLITKYTLNMNQITGWSNSEQLRNLTNAILTGDTEGAQNAKDRLTLNGYGTQQKTEAAEKYNSLKKEYDTLSKTTNRTSKQNARMKAIQTEVSKLRSQYGFSGYQVDTLAIKSESKSIGNLDKLQQEYNALTGKSSSSNNYNAAAAAKEYNTLKQEYTKLASIKSPTNDQKNRMTAIEKRITYIRDKYGFNGYQVTGYYANGIDYVGYNNFPSLLHKGERVMTAKANDTFTAFMEMMMADYSNNNNRQISNLDKKMTEASVINNVENNNYDSFMHIDTFVNKSGSDETKIAQQINSKINIKNRAKGKRK